MFTLSIISSFLASVTIIFACSFVLFKDRRDQVHQYYAVFGFSSSGILVTMFLTYVFPDSEYLTQINRITQMSTAMSFATLFTLSLIFPKREKRFPLGYTVLIILPALVVCYIAYFTEWNITKAYIKDGVLVREYGFFYTIYAGIVFFYLLLGIANFIRKYVTLKVEAYRLQMRFVFVGTSIAMLIAAVFSIIMPRFFNYSELYVLGPSIASFIAMGSLFYSIVSYNMMDISTAVHKTAMYTIISMVIFIPLYGVIKLFDMKYWFLGDVPPFIIAGVIVVIFLLFSTYIQPIIDRVFKRKQYEFEGILDNYIRDAEKVKDFRSIVHRSVDILSDTLYLKRAFFIMLSNETRKYELFYLKGETIVVDAVERNSPIIRWFVRNQEILNLDRVYRDEKSFADIREDFTSFFDRYGLRVVLPIYHQRRVLGLLCLGDKDSLAAYKPDELDKLRYFQMESNVHISNALTYEESRREQLLNRTIDLTSQILARSVPETLPNLIGMKFGAFFIPRYKEGIDYFDFIRPGNQGVGVISTDIAGVGLNSAIYSVILRSAFQSCIQEAPSTYTVIQRLNRVLYEYSGGKGGFITAFYYYYDIKSMRLIYSNAGFPPLELYRIEKNDFDSLDTEGIPLGYDPGANYGMGRTNLLRGDIGILYSKALISSKNQKGEVFGLVQLRNLVKENRAGRPQEIAKVVKESFAAFMGLSSPESDIVVIVFKVV